MKQGDVMSAEIEPESQSRNLVVIAALLNKHFSGSAIAEYDHVLIQAHHKNTITGGMLSLFPYFHKRHVLEVKLCQDMPHIMSRTYAEDLHIWSCTAASLPGDHQFASQVLRVTTVADAR